jgi:hypothetical protein
MGLPIVYRKSPSISASYDAIDVLEGVGIINFYGGCVSSSAATTYRLDRKTFRCTATSENVMLTHTDGTTAETDFTKIIDKDFDTSAFNMPAVLGGTAIISVPFGTSVSEPSEEQFYAVVAVIKVNAASAETSLVSVQSPTLTTSTASFTNSFFSIPAVIPTTTIGAGEKIRITVEIWSKKVSGGAIFFSIAHDPQGGAITGATNYPNFSSGFTSFEAHLPFKIDL